MAFALFQQVPKRKRPATGKRGRSAVTTPAGRRGRGRGASARKRKDSESDEEEVSEDEEEEEVSEFGSEQSEVSKPTKRIYDRNINKQLFNLVGGTSQKE